MFKIMIPLFICFFLVNTHMQLYAQDTDTTDKNDREVDELEMDISCEELEACGNGYCAPYCGECGDDTPNSRCADCQNELGREMCLTSCDPSLIDVETGLCNVCGDGMTAGDEECDDENYIDGDGCDSNCTTTRCGNGIQSQGEICDDGNQVDGDGCDSNCTLSACGNGIVSVDEDGNMEECDDGNRMNGDECDADCSLPRCGNGIISRDEDGSQEECDDGNDDPNDACVNCQEAYCGDGIVWEGVEACDDGNQSSVDGCTTDCQLDSCGNGIVDEGEECDDGNNDPADGCRNNCLNSCEDDECVCSLLDTVTPTIDVSLKIPPGDQDAISFKLNLPKLGKGVATSFNFEYFAKGQTANCKTNCVANFNGGIRGKWEATVLTETVDADISGFIDITEEKCILCDAETCLKSCGERRCLDQGGGGSASMNYTRTFPLFPTKQFEYKIAKLTLGCSAVAGFGLGLAAQVKNKKPGRSQQCEPCGACEEYSATVSGQVNGGVSCQLGINAAGLEASASIGGQFNVKPEIKYQYGRGEGCDSSGFCSHAKVSADIGAMGSICLKLKFFNVKANCSLGYKGEAEAGCEGFKSKSDGLKYECSTTLTHPSDCSKKCTRVCRRGVPCGNVCQSPNKACNRPPGTACQGPPPELSE